MKSVSLGGCSPMSILIALVIGGIILIMVASVNDARQTTGSVLPTATLISPLVAPANSSGPAGQSFEGSVNASTNGANTTSSSGESACTSGCLLDNMCGGTQSIIARIDPTSNQRYFYTPDHPGYEAFRTAETLGQTNYYFCTAAQAESQNWTRAP